MEFLLGVVLTIAYFVCGFVGYNMGKRSATAPVQKEVSEANEEERRKAKRLREGFEQMMSYNETKARKGQNYN